MSEKPATGTGDGGEGGATENSEGGTTMAVQKKRLRRVSFAEMTSVHFFDRDEDNETPAEEVAAKAREEGNAVNGREEKNDLLGFRELMDSRGEDEEEDRENGDGDSEDEELAIMRRSFLRPAESPSPGSTFGSATSNDDAEDDFFGPVSASFIRPGCLSDSAASNDKHDVTMDSTAFSMHFRSLARSDSGVDLKTPTGIHLSFEEKTPTQTNAGSSMELTVPKKPSSQLFSPARNSGSSDMSLVGEKSNKYDYGRISPDLDALLAEGSKKMHPTSASGSMFPSKSPQGLESNISPSDNNGSGLRDIIQKGKIVSSLINRFGEANGVCSSPPVSHSDSGLSSNISKPLAPDVLIDYSNSSSPSHLGKMKASPSHQDKLCPEDKYIQLESSWVKLVSSSPAKGRKILATSSSPARYMSVATPQEQRCSHLHNENVKHHESASAVQKSISKLKLLEASPFSSYLTAKIENSNIEALTFPTHSPLRNFSERVISDSQMKHQEAPVAGTEVQPSEAFNKQVLCASSNDNNQIEDTADAGHIIHYGESIAAFASPSEFTLPKKNLKPGFRSRSPREKKSVTAGTGTDSILAEIALDHGGTKIVSTPKKIVPSSDKELEKKWISPKLHGQLSNDLMLHDRLMRLKKISPGHESASKGGITDSSTCIASLNELDSFSLTRKVQLSSIPVGFSCSKLIDVNHQNQQSSSGIIESLRTPTEAKESHFICPKRLDWGPQTGMQLPSFEGDHPGGESESDLPSKDMGLKESMHQNYLVDSFGKSPSRKEVEISNENKGLSNAEDILFPSSNNLSSLSRKRSNEGQINHTNGLAFQNSPKLQKVGTQVLETQRCLNGDGGENSAVVLNLKHWTDIYSRFLKDTENLLSPPIDKLDLSLIELLENILFNLQRSKTYGILHGQIFAQKTSVVDDLSHQRVSEARSLLHQILHEKAKSQLMSLKRQKLQEKVQLLSSGIQESQTLKLKFKHGCKGDAQADASAFQTLVNSRTRGEVECERIVAMKQTLEALEKKSTNLIQTLTTACKVKEEPSIANSISIVTNHLMKKSCFQFIRLDMQMWIIDDVKSKNGNWDIVLNYHDFIFQSLKVSVPPASSMTISYKLDDINIMKNFPDMDACAAFSFVFNAETTRKCSGLRSLTQEIQVTGSFLGNLIDVVQEVKLARMELRHLTQATFHCPLGGKLYLQLDFFSFERGKKVTLTLDLSCLKRGIYPSQMLPAQSTVVYGVTSLPSAPILDEVRDALNSLRAGYTRILRLCRLVVQVIQVSREL